MVLALLVGWVVCSVLTTVVCSAVARGGVAEDRVRGYLTDRV